METRRVARFLVVDPLGRVLLFQFARPSGERFWATPGGGLEDGESFEEAAVREGSEELGIDSVRLVPLWHSTYEYLHEGRPVLLEAKFFFLRVDGIEFTERVLEAHRRDRILETRWWTAADLDATQEVVFPKDLAQRLRGIEELPP